MDICKCKEVKAKEIFHTLLELALDSRYERTSKKAKEYLIECLSK